MVLGSSALRHEIEFGNLKVSPMGEKTIQPASIDLTLGRQFLAPHPAPGEIVRFGTPLQYESVEADRFIIPGNSFVLARTVETVEIPEDMAAFVEGRSSVGRMGLFIQNAGWVDPGFKGSITLELYNGLATPVEVVAGWRICQLVVDRLEGDSEGGYKGKYQGQIEATGSQLYKDGCAA